MLDKISKKWCLLGEKIDGSNQKFTARCRDLKPYLDLRQESLILVGQLRHLCTEPDVRACVHQILGVVREAVNLWLVTQDLFAVFLNTTRINSQS